MTPNPTPRRLNSARRSDRPLVRLPMLAAAALLLLAATASAQLPIPPTAQQVATPLGTTDIYADGNGARICTDNAASTAMVPLPLPVPAAASAAAKGCVKAGLDGVDADLHAQGHASAADLEQSAKADASAGKDAEGTVQAHGVLDVMVHWLMSLF